MMTMMMREVADDWQQKDSYGNAAAFCSALHENTSSYFLLLH